MPDETDIPEPPEPLDGPRVTLAGIPEEDEDDDAAVLAYLRGEQPTAPAEETDSDVVASLEARRGEGRPCKKCGMPMVAPEGGKLAPNQRFHPDCRPGAKHNGMTGSGTTINVNAGSPSKSRGSKPTKAEDLAQVEANAKVLLEWAAAGVVMFAGANATPALKADMTTVHGAAPTVAQSIANVARHEEWLRKLLAGGQTSDRGRAWLQLALVVGTTIGFPVLANHGLIPSELLKLADQAAAAGAGNIAA